ncbi:MAG: gluconeogenesis factor YvcK family protein [Minisyncoccia bacterium]
MKKVVRIGGGSSGYTILRGLKQFPLDITAIVNMFDSGGSSGALRDELGILPPGDVRRALAALAEGKNALVLRELFNFRFKENGSVNGHSFGNLFLAALAAIYGSDIEAIRKASKILGLKGKVLPVSLDKSHIHAVLEDGTEIVGETNIDIPKHDGNLRIQKLYLSPAAKIFPEAEEAILNADVIVIGPGDLYTSIIPNLIVDGMPEALRESKARKVVVCNLMTKWGETHGFTAVDMAKELARYSGLEKFDFAICNTKKPSKKLIAAYEAEKKYPMVCNDELSKYAEQVITGDFFSEADIARHDADKLAKVIAEL